MDTGSNIVLQGTGVRLKAVNRATLFCWVLEPENIITGQIPNRPKEDTIGGGSFKPPAIFPSIRRISHHSQLKDSRPCADIGPSTITIGPSTI